MTDHEQALADAKARVPRGDSRYALKVLTAWFNQMDAQIILSERERGCPDCGTTATLFYTRSYHGTCPPCTLSRLENRGKNTRLANPL